MIIWGILLGGLVFLKQKWAKAPIAVLIVGYIILVFVGINEVPKFAQNKLIFSEIKKALYTPSVIKNTPNALNTDTLNTKQKSPFYFLCILLCILFSLLHKITSKITHISKI